MFFFFFYCSSIHSPQKPAPPTDIEAAQDEAASNFQVGSTECAAGMP